MQPTPPDSPIESSAPVKHDGWKDKFGGRLLRRLTSKDSVPRAARSSTTQISKPASDPAPSGITAAIWDTVKDVPKLGLGSVKTLVEIQEAAALHENVDDRTYLMEKLIQAAVKVEGDNTGKHITDNFITTLWNDLQHPPTMNMASEFKYRQADGSNNSWLHPKLGASHQPYARTVQPKTIQPGNLPDPGIIFDSVLVRKKATPHPNQISSVLFYLASIIIHDLFRTNHRDFSISDTSSYLDLAPLYGSDADEQKAMRTLQDGKIKPDCFSEVRLLTFPPGVGALLIMFNRFHNHVVEQLAAINEKGRFDPPSQSNHKTAETLDEDLFQTGRLITCGLYINIILLDYVRTILNLNKTDDNWQLNPREDFPGGPEMGTGNQVSAEFNLVYRWHAAVSDRDDKWTQALFTKLFGDRKFDDIPQREFLMTLGGLERNLQSSSPENRPFNGMTREANGNFKDEDLLTLLMDSVDDCANAFGPQQVPAVMKAIEVLGIQQARSWNLATLNEFRKHFMLKPHESFSDITKDQKVAQQLEHLYGHPDHVELYPGLVVEDAKVPMLPGSGLCPSYTVSRAVLSDAVALVRGDRFYTTSYQPSELTNWGFAEASSDMSIDNGCCFYKLFLRAFPGHFDPDSSYIHYPMTVASEMERVITKLGKANKYVFERPSVTPTKAPEASPSTTSDDSIAIFGEPEQSISLLDGKDKSYERPIATILNKIEIGDGIDAEHLTQQSRDFIETTTVDLLSRKAYVLAGFAEVDMVRDIINMAPLYFVADLFGIPLKTEGHSDGLITVEELQMLFMAVLVSGSGFDDVQSINLRQQAQPNITELRKHMSAVFPTLKKHGHVHKSHSELVAVFPFISRLANSDLEEHQVFAAIMLLASTMAIYESSVLSEALDAALQSDASVLTQMRQLAQQKTSEAEQELLKIVHDLVNKTSQPATMPTHPKINTGVWQRVNDDAILSMLKVILRTCPGLRPAKIWTGTSVPATLKKIPVTRTPQIVEKTDAVDTPVEPAANVDAPIVSEEQSIRYAYLTEKWDRLSPIPTTLKLNWDLTAEGYPTPSASVHSSS